MRNLFLISSVLLAVGCAAAGAAPAATNRPSASRILMIEPSSIAIDGGKVTLTIGALQRTNGIYYGTYKIRVVPYFFENEKGSLAIVVSDESLARINQGKFEPIVGTATTSGKSGKSRHIDATAMPANGDSGMIKLWFTSGDRKMSFEPAYHLAEVAPTTQSNLTANKQ